MHIEAYTYMRRELNGRINDSLSVLEIGSRWINGSVRTLASGAGRYVGIDPVAGKGVDIVSDAAGYDGEHQFDIVLSTETMEHMERPEEVIDCALRALKPGGLLLLTAAGVERAPHSATGGELDEGEPYTPIDALDLAGWLDGWIGVTIRTDPTHGDVYAKARAPRTEETSLEVTPEPEPQPAATGATVVLSEPRAKTWKAVNEPEPAQEFQP